MVMKELLIKLYRELTYFRYNTCEYLKLKFFYPEDYQLIKINSSFKNIHEGKRCFILGNGPSIKKVDLKSLASEYVFTVNQASRMPGFDLLKTNYHFWADELFFKTEDTEENRELRNSMRNVNTEDNKPIVFFPLAQKGFVKQFSLDKDLNVRYFKTGIQMYKSYKHEMDFSKVGPSFCTVVQWCISMAIYMGFNEIYLLGCDNTGLLVNLKSALKQNDDDDYAYHVTEIEKKRLENQFNYTSVEAFTESYLKNIKEYRYLSRYCNIRGIKLINCSSTTVLDSVQRMHLEDVI